MHKSLILSATLLLPSLLPTSANANWFTEEIFGKSATTTQTQKPTPPQCTRGAKGQSTPKQLTVKAQRLYFYDRDTHERLSNYVIAGDKLIIERELPDGWVDVIYKTIHYQDSIKAKVTLWRVAIRLSENH